MAKAAHEFDLKKLVDSFELNDDERKLIAEALGRDKNQAVLKDGWMAQSDYSFHMNTIKEKEQELSNKLSEEERYLQELNDWKSTQDGSIDEIRANYARVNGEVTALKTYLEAQGIDPSTVVTGIVPPTPDPKKEEPKVEFDTSKFVTREQAAMLAKWPVVYDQLSREHQRLFGQPMDGTKLFEELMKSQEAPEQVFNRLFNVEARKTELAQEERKQWEAQTRKELEVQVRSEVQAGQFIPTGPGGQVAPVIQEFGVKGMKNSDNWQQQAAQDYLTRLQAREAGQPIPQP